MSHLHESAKVDMHELIYESLFSDHPTQSNVVHHDIDIGYQKPIKQHGYRVNPIKCVAMQEEVSYLLENGFTMPSSSAIFART